MTGMSESPSAARSEWDERPELLLRPDERPERPWLACASMPMPVRMPESIFVDLTRSMAEGGFFAFDSAREQISSAKLLIFWLKSSWPTADMISRMRVW